MNESVFDGQQEGERILFEIHPHVVVQQLAIAKVIVIALIFLILILIIGSLTQAETMFFAVGIFISFIIFGAGTWWNNQYFRDTHAFITDRRIMRFERVSPFLVTKRALFWNEAMKAKSYQPNLILQKFNIGTLIIEPTTPADENVIVNSIYYAEDLANYIDKILFTFKNNPSELAAIQPFVAKPKGYRD